MTDTTQGLGRALPGRWSMPRWPSNGLLALVGPVLVALPAAYAGWLGLTGYAGYGAEAAFGIAVGAAAVVLMAEALILAARPRLIEPLFGGLDRMYRAHRWLGIASLALMVVHDLSEPDFDHAVRETNLGETAEGAGEFAFYALIGLIALSLLRRLPLIRLEVPYQLWRFSHRFMGVLFGLVVFHQFFIDLPTDVDPALSQILNGFGIAGLLAFVFTEVVAPRLRQRDFTVQGIARQGNTTLVTLAPLGRKLRWTPGQFAFLSAPAAGMAEPHPFTIASAPAADGTLKLVVRGLGGWTRRLPKSLREGAPVRLEGPYGRFDYRKGGARQVWVAGGVGITPFQAWAESLPASERRQIHLVHCVAKPEDAIGAEVLRATADRLPGFSWQVVVTGRDGRLTAEDLVRAAPFALRGADMFFCGPAGLRRALVAGLAALGQGPRRLHYERFDFA